MKKNNVVSLPKLSKIKTKLYSNDISSSQLINESSILWGNQTMLNPKVKDKKYMLGEIDKIIKECNSEPFNNEPINGDIKNTEEELKYVGLAVSKMNELAHKPKKIFRKVAKQEIAYNRNSIKIMIRDMKKSFIRARAI